MNEPLVYVIILNWRGLRDTCECCQSLAKVTYGNMRVLVVDNGSGDGSGALLAKEFPQFEHISNQANLGFTGGNNAIIEQALREGATWCDRLRATHR
jgi:GT2 family glycosyltransferase